MQLMIIVVLYFICVFLIRGSLTALAKMIGRLTPKSEKWIAALSWVWPIWGQLAVLAAFGCLIYKGWQIVFGTPDARKDSQ